jgi:hypothetical protein
MVVCAPVAVEEGAAEDEARYVRIVGVTGRPQLTDTTHNHLQLSFLRGACGEPFAVRGEDERRRGFQ